MSSFLEMNKLSKWQIYLFFKHFSIFVSFMNESWISFKIRILCYLRFSGILFLLQIFYHRIFVQLSTPWLCLLCPVILLWCIFMKNLARIIFFSEFIARWSIAIFFTLKTPFKVCLCRSWWYIFYWVLRIFWRQYRFWRNAELYQLVRGHWGWGEWAVRASFSTFV